jgi:hypothetical protein
MIDLALTIERAFINAGSAGSSALMATYTASTSLLSSAIS